MVGGVITFMQPKNRAPRAATIAAKTRTMQLGFDVPIKFDDSTYLDRLNALANPDLPRTLTDGTVGEIARGAAKQETRTNLAREFLRQKSKMARAISGELNAKLQYTANMTGLSAQVSQQQQQTIGTVASNAFQGYVANETYRLSLIHI